MLNRSHFSKYLKLLILNFNISIAEEKILACYENLKNQLTDQEFSEAITNIIHTQPKLFGLPSVAEFMEAAGKPALTLEQQTIIAVNKLIDYARICFDTEVITDDPYLNQTLHDYGGIRKLCWDLDSHNDEKKDIKWIRKELDNFYKANKLANRGCMIPSIKEEIRKDYFGRAISTPKRGFIGDKKKIQEMLEIEVAKKGESKAQEIISNLANQLRKI